MSDVSKLKQEVQVLTDEAQFAIGRADNATEEVYILEQENRQLKHTLNRIINLLDSTEGDTVSKDEVQGIVFGTR